MHIDKNEAMRYMGYKGQNMDESLNSLMDECIEEVKAASGESFTYGIFDIERNAKGIGLAGTTLVLQGEAIGIHLKKSDKCAVMAVTLGLEIDRRIALYSKTNLTKGLIFDACAAAAVEALCDEVQEEIKAKAAVMGLKITTRFSPGYGDLPLDIQSDIIRVLKAYERTGISVNESSIMIPRKSVTAVIGMQHEECSIERHKCSSCGDKFCLYRRESGENG